MAFRLIHYEEKADHDSGEDYPFRIKFPEGASNFKMWALNVDDSDHYVWFTSFDNIDNKRVTYAIGGRGENRGSG